MCIYFDCSMSLSKFCYICAFVIFKRFARVKNRLICMVLNLRSVLESFVLKNMQNARVGASLPTSDEDKIEHGMSCGP